MKKQVSNAKYCVVSGLVVSFVLFVFAVSAWAAAARTKIDTACGNRTYD